nr:MAG TPA: portal protein [Caudoviricetes sp.]
MFEFLFQDRNKELRSTAEMIAVELEKLNLSKLAIEKAEGMIAKAIAKSDILLQTKSDQKRKLEYRLNIQPNDNENGTYFWTKVVKTLLREEEAVIIRMGKKYYRVSTWSTNDTVLSGRIYRDIMIENAGKTYKLNKTFLASEVIHLRYENARVRLLLNTVVEQYDKTLNSINAMMRMANLPKFKLKIDAPGAYLVEAGENGKEGKKYTREQYAEKIKKLLETEELTVLAESQGVLLESMDIKTSVKAEELSKVANEINNTVAAAYDIPEAVFQGNITEKSDATNEFITYAVGPIAEVINDELTAKLVGADDYANKKEKVLVWLARFKHVDVVDNASNLDKLRSDGWSFDEIREMVGYPILDTDFSNARALTKNYSTGEEGEGVE